MRNIIKIQTDMFINSIEEIELDTHSRDEMPQILMGIKSLYSDSKIYISILNELKKMLPSKINYTLGRPGMDLWHILVLGLVRLSHNCDFDKLTDLANNHKNLRLFLNLSATDTTRYGRQTLVDNLSFFTPEILERINDIVVAHGYAQLGVSGPSKCRSDSFVFETNVHYPTDITLIFDGVRSVVTKLSKLCTFYTMRGWREWKSLLKKIHRSLRKIQLVRKGKPKKEAKKEEKRVAEIDASKIFHLLVHKILEKANESVVNLLEKASNDEHLATSLKDIISFISKTKTVSYQLIRRVVEDEVIPHSEKIFSVFEEYTEWISKGKAGVPQELGVRIAIVEGDYGFIPHWKIMFQQTDDKVAVELVEETLKKYPLVKSFSFDKGFWTPRNKKELEKSIETLILPQKGKESQETKKRTSTPEYRKLRGEHSRIESAVNALENHGLDRCPDKGKKAYERYVGLAIVARNILQLGKICMAREKNLKIVA